jgi:hypothetical protein
MRVEAFAEQTHEHGSENAGTFSARLCVASPKKHIYLIWPY